MPIQGPFVVNQFVIVRPALVAQLEIEDRPYRVVSLAARQAKLHTSRGALLVDVENLAHAPPDVLEKHVALNEAASFFLYGVMPRSRVDPITGLTLAEEHRRYRMRRDANLSGEAYLVEVDRIQTPKGTLTFAQLRANEGRHVDSISEEYRRAFQSLVDGTITNPQLRRALQRAYTAWQDNHDS